VVSPVDVWAGMKTTKTTEAAEYTERHPVAIR
jgi:hypothetical protein